MDDKLKASPLPSAKEDQRAPGDRATIVRLGKISEITKGSGSSNSDNPNKWADKE
jgi:hypothetical protein